MSGVRLDLTEYMEGEIKLVVIGNTNVGKSTYLNNLLGVSNFLNISEIRETACLWIIKSHTEKPDFELKAKYLNRNTGEFFEDSMLSFKNIEDLKSLMKENFNLSN